ncbi:cyclin-dependent kinase inhibitor 3 family protein [Shewanella avicenniae]|uniref:protein-tyrosine-phosphatase n=1 Tax=Shewanella avicenniae TaxID=2814294 RepID=A0ABX7QVC6_9GAMM|nr:cyclin-dependent kinase inhibitor 3 family protein [Shewanella avicenniae]QSX34875.1 cyclin-dependent kinase inhibitor 3 family protein [Shewanella avicenniae]
MALLRTSETHPLQIAAVQHSADSGRIGITFCPGKYDPWAATGGWRRDLQLDVAAIKAWGATAVLTLVEQHELVSLKVPTLGEVVQQQGMAWLHLPIADYSVPGAAFEIAWATAGKQLRQQLRQQQDIVVHCKGGLGRAGMIAARLLIELGTPVEDAIQQVRQQRKGAIETAAQLALVRSWSVIDDE